MRELVAQGAIDLRGILFTETWVERDQVAARIGAAGGAEQARIPLHVDFAAELFGIQRGENFAGRGFQRGIASQHDRRKGRRKNEIELLVII